MATTHTLVDAPPDAVWGVLADAWRFPTWVVGCSHVRAVDPSWPAVGARAFHAVGVWPLTVSDRTTVDEVAPSTRLRMTSRAGRLGATTITVELAAASGGTRVTMTEDLAGGADRPTLRRLAAPLIRWRNRQALTRLAAQAERPAAPHD